MMASTVSSTLKDVEEKTILIIGAGISGLSAASRLKSHGFKKVLILEARSRVGGRIHTVDYGSGVIEMGAQWIHGQKENAVYDLAKKNSLVDESGSLYDQKLFSWSNVCSKEEKNIILQTVKFLEEKISELQKGICEHERNMFSYLQNCFRKYVASSGNSSQQKKIMNSAFQWYLNYQYELNGCENLSSVSAHLLSHYHECEGLPLVELERGYSSILEVLLATFSNDWILRNKQVCNIILQTAVPQGTGNHEMKPIKVICSDGSVYMVDHVIVTIPLGCLKTSVSSLFSPPLPSQKIEAIQRLGFGVLNKIYLKYEKPFWEPEFIFNVLWDPVTNWERSADDCTEESQAWYKSINRFSFVKCQPDMLCAWVAGFGATLMEKLPIEQVICDCHEVLKMKLQKENLPFPIDAFRSEWSSDEFAKGSYSYLSVDCDEQDIKNMDLAQPVCIEQHCGQHPVILFAGEATHPHFYSTVHGAYETGIREADRIHFHYWHSHTVGSELSQLPDSLITKINVAVIGAGASGFACAQRLAKAGIKDIVILEAQSRLGGRIHTVTCEESVVELGAQWIHGEEGNPLYEYCQEHDLLVDPKVCVTSEAKGLFCTPGGRVIPEVVVDEVMFKMQELKEMVNNIIHVEGQAGTCMNEIFCNGFEKYMETCQDESEIKAWKKGIFKWFLKFEVIDNACESLQDITTLGYASWTECPGYFYTSFKNGFSSFLYSLKKEIPVASIFMSKPVKCIHWKTSVTSHEDKNFSNFPALIECCDGDWFAAKHVVVTSSVGFIQDNLRTFFNPCLPEKKEVAFKKTGFGTTNKIFLLFPYQFWTDEELGFQLVWMEDSDIIERFSMDETSWVYGISGFDRVFNQPNVLVTWVGGPYAKQVEELSNDMIGKICTHLLREFLPDRNIPYPVKIIRSCWANDKYIKGSYSSRPQMFYEAGCTVSDLNEPLFHSHILHDGRVIQWPIVSFAGEAMDEEYFAAVHGALRSGWVEADRIIKFSENINNLKEN